MRSYKASRRRALKQPVPFEFNYEVAVEDRDEDGALVGTHFEERVEHFVAKGDVSTLLLSELAANADVDTATPEGMRLIRDFFAQAFGDDEQYSRFFRLVTRYGDDDLLMEIMSGLVEDLMGRPTMRPSDSPATPSTSGEPSKVVSLQRGTVQVVEGQVLDSTEEPQASSG